MGVLMLTISDGHDISPRYLLSQNELQRHDAVNRQMFRGALYTEGKGYARNRNLAVADFLNHDHEWAWFVDADQVLRPDTLDRLLDCAVEHDSLIVGALIAIIGPDRPIPNLYFDNDAGPGRFTTPLDYPDEPVAVGATGAGCLLIHRSVLETMRSEQGHDHWFGDTLHPGADGELCQTGEDLSFCLAARRHRYRIVVDCTTHVGHHKDNRVWWPEDCRRPFYEPAGEVA